MTRLMKLVALPRLVVLLGFGALLCLGPLGGASVAAQDPDYQLSMPDLTAFSGGIIEVPVHLDNFGGGIQGWSLGVEHGPADLTLLGVFPGGTSVELDPDFFQILEFANGWAAGVVLSVLGIDEIDPGVGYELHRALYTVNLAEGESTAVAFTNDLGKPPVTTQVVVGGASIIPVTIDSTIEALGVAPNAHLILALDDAGGAVDSAALLESALVARGESVVVSDFFLPQIPPAVHAVWVLAGTFPHNHVLTPAQGVVLAAAVQAGTPVYFESNDAWGFDPPTAFAQYDGVDGAEAGDGDDTFIGMVGSTFGAADLTGLDATYLQDQPGDDSTDRLVPSTTDLAGPTAGVIWSDDGAGGSRFPYDTGIFYDTEPGFGRVLVQSWELGGYGGDGAVVVGRYLSALGLDDELDFIRGDANGDAVIDLADPLFIDAELFTGGPASPCPDASDANDDGLRDIADTIYLLSYLFVSGAEPPAPGPLDCGPDGTPDDLDCAISACP